MHITSFGRFIRNYRMEKGILLGEMAKELNVSASYLSAIEYGNKRIPTDMEEKIILKYELTIDERNQLKEAIIDTNESIDISLTNVNKNHKQTAVLFARKFQELDDNTLLKIRAVLEEKVK